MDDSIFTESINDEYFEYNKKRFIDRANECILKIKYKNVIEELKDKIKKYYIE